MRRILLVLAVTLVCVVVSATAVMAQEGPTPNEHNCGGVSSVETIDALGGQTFGTLVSDEFAQEQLIDNFTQANCNQNPRQNP